MNIAYGESIPAMSKLIIKYALFLLALSSAVVQSKKGIASYNENEKIVSRVANGSTAGEGEYTWSMSIWSMEEIKCMSALITRKTALTAAHCLFNVFKRNNSSFAERIPLSHVHGKIGDIQKRLGKMIRFSRDIVHEDYHFRRSLNDIALLILSERIELSDRISTIPISHVHKEYHGKADVAGWGSCSKVSRILPEKLQVVEMEIMDPVRCRNFFNITLQKVTYICATAEKKGPCNGDSGASLIYGEDLKKMSIGVCLGDRVGTKTGECAVFLSTGYYAEWIINNAEGHVMVIS